MSKERKNLLDRIIRIYGFENPITIQFANICESWKKKDQLPLLEAIVKSHEEFPQICVED